MIATDTRATTPSTASAPARRYWHGLFRELLSWLLPAVLGGGIALLRWTQVGEFVTGLDAGNWLAVGHDYLGSDSKATEVVYPPLVPIIVASSEAVVGPMVAAKLVATGSLLAVLVATYVVAVREMPWWTAGFAAVTVGLSSVVAEPVAFGGYPQNLALALLIVAVASLSDYLQTESRSSQLAGGVALGAAALTHHLYFLMAVLVASLIWLFWLTSGPAREPLIRRTAGVALTGVVGIVAFAPTLIALWSAGFDPTINAAGSDLREGMQYATREAPTFWLIFFGVGAGFITWSLPRRDRPIWRLAAATMIAPAGMFLISREPRLLPLLVTGAALSVGLALHLFWLRTRGTAWSVLPIVLAVVLPLYLWPRADAVTAEYFDYYRTVDQSLLDAADYIDEHHGDGWTVVKSNRRGWPIGWWFEGLTEARIVVGSDERWLGFPEEVANARLAEQFFTGQMTGQQVATLANDHDVEFLVFRKWEWIGWQDWLSESEPVVTVVFDDDEFMVLDVDPA